MKKILTFSLVAIMALSLASCGGGNSGLNEDGTYTPKGTVTWVCTSGAGGGSDIFSRKIAEIMTNENMVNGQTIVVSNETDGAGEVGRYKVATKKVDVDNTLLTFNSGDLMPMVANTPNRAENFRILAIMALDKQLLFTCETAAGKTDYAKSGGDPTDFGAAIEAAKNGTFVVIGLSLIHI